jgi:hypothetical protein
MAPCEENQIRTTLLAFALVAYASLVLFVFEGYHPSSHDSIAAMSALSGPSSATPAQQQRCAEIVTFQIMDAVISREDFVRAGLESNAALAALDGFLSRTLTVDDDGVQWTDYIVWEDRESALNGAKVIMEDPRFHAFARVIVGSSVVMKHSTIQLQV